LTLWVWLADWAYGVPLTPEKEALLHQLASRTGKETTELPNRGELIEHDEVVARIEKRIREKQSQP